MPQGTVKWFNPSKGYGFVTPDDGGEDAYLHKSIISGGETISEGDVVEFEMEKGDKGPKVTSVKVIKKAPEKKPKGKTEKKQPKPRAPDTAEKEAKPPFQAKVLGATDPDGWHTVSLEVIGTDGKPAKGTVSISPQEFVEVKGLKSPNSIGVNGRRLVQVRITNTDKRYLTATFTHKATNHPVSRLLKRGERS